MGKRTNFAFCPPRGNYGTICAYQWTCPNGPNGQPRKRAPYFSNPKVSYEGVPTGDAKNNNAAYMTSERFSHRDDGNNCFDGKPDYKWMNFKDNGKIGNNCKNGQKSFEPPINKCEGNVL